MAAKVTTSRRGIAELLSSGDVEAHLLDLAESVANSARAYAPVVSGGYRDSIGVEAEQHRNRVVVRVVADVPYASAVEAGTGNLARALGSA